MKPRRTRHGVALLEVVVSLLMLGLAGTALIALMGQSAHSLHEVRDDEILARRASDELARFVTYDRTQLMASVGASASRGWLVSVVQRAPDLFDVVISDTLTRAQVLSTTFYRPDSNDALTR